LIGHRCNAQFEPLGIPKARGDDRELHGRFAFGVMRRRKCSKTRGFAMSFERPPERIDSKRVLLSYAPENTAVQIAESGRVNFPLLFEGGGVKLR